MFIGSTCSRCAFALTILAASCGPSLAAASPGMEDRVVRIARFATAPEVDGKLDEDVWREAAVLEGFHQTQPGDNTPPSRATEVRLGYDTTALYIGIRAADDSESVRATVAKRDDVLRDDHVRVYLDTFDDRRRAYLLIFNPLGVQQDGIYTEGRDPDYSFDLVMRSKGVVADDGYTIEVAVPFTSLRYEAGGGARWGIHVQRQIKHMNDEEDSWMPLARGRAGFLAQAGHVVGLEGLVAERTFELIPSLTVSESGKRLPATPARFVNRPVGLDPGLTAKVGLTPTVTLDVAINPDFAQVEADQLVVTANQRFPIFFEEKRPFFLEGIDVFRTPLDAVHTRAIVDPDAAVKLTGKLGRNTFALLAASDNAPGDFSEEELADPAANPGIERFAGKNATIGVLRLKRDVGAESSLGLVATSYNFVEKHNQLFGFDGRLALDPRTVFSFQVLGTSSRRFFYDPERDESAYRTGNGLGYYMQLERTGRHLNLLLAGDGRTADYRADVGFTLQTNANRWRVTTTYNSEPDPEGKLVSWSVLHTALAQFDWQGRMKYTYSYPRVLLNFRHETYVNVHAYVDYLRLLEDEFGARRSETLRGAFFGAEGRRTLYKGVIFEAGTTLGKKYSASITIDRAWNAFDYDFGAGPRFPRVSPTAIALGQGAPLDPGTGNTLDVNAAFNWQPTDALRCALSLVTSRLVRNDTNRVAYDQRLVSLRTTYQFTRFTFARARVDYDSLRANVAGQFLVGWAPNPGTSFYAGYNEDLSYNGHSPFTGEPESGLRRNGRTFFVKMSYLLRRD
jgi:hypothetical protein